MKPKSSIPGRIRWKHNNLKNNELLLEVKSKFESLKEIYRVEINRPAGSVTLFYDPAIGPGDFEKSSLSLLKPYFPDQPGIQKNTIKKTLRKITKIGALASIGLTLGGIIAKNYKFHGYMGYLFLGFLGTHIFQNRKTLFK